MTKYVCIHGHFYQPPRENPWSHKLEVTLTNYANFIDLQSPKFEIEIHPNSSWSCIHGIERWRNDCGCNSDKGFHQAWRGPLRAALDWLRDQLAPLYEDNIGLYLKDPWSARNDFIMVINDANRFSEFIQKNAIRSLSFQEERCVLQWCELQRNALLMYTSCGWFFDELSGIETVQILKYAGHAIQLAKQLTGNDFEPEFLSNLAAIPSNLEAFKNGAVIYHKLVKFKQ